MTVSKRVQRLAAAALACTILAALPGQVHAKDEGLAIAQHNCARCHQISPDTKPKLEKPPPAPSFVDIANAPDKYPEAKLYAVLSGPHAKMAPFSFTAVERRSLIDYIHSLAKK